MESAYWTWRNSQWHNLPEPGGSLDQDSALMEDLDTYHRWYRMAENQVAQEKEALEKARRRQL